MIHSPAPSVERPVRGGKRKVHEEAPKTYADLEHSDDGESDVDSSDEAKQKSRARRGAKKVKVKSRKAPADEDTEAEVPPSGAEDDDDEGSDDDAEYMEENEDERPDGVGGRRTKTPEEKAAEALIVAAFSSDGRKNFNQLRKIVRFFVRAIGSASESGSVLFQLLRCANKLLPEGLHFADKNRARQLALAAPARLLDPMTAKAAVLGPLAELRGATFTKFMTHFKEFAALVLYVQMANCIKAKRDMPEAAPGVRSAEASRLKALFESQGMDENFIAMQLAARDFPTAEQELQTVFNNTIATINALSEDACVRSVLKQVVALGEDLGGGAALGSAWLVSSREARDRSLYDQTNSPKDAARTAKANGIVHVEAVVHALPGGKTETYLVDEGLSLEFNEKSAPFPSAHNPLEGTRVAVPLRASLWTAATPTAVIAGLKDMWSDPNTQLGKAHAALGGPLQWVRIVAYHKKAGGAWVLHETGHDGPGLSHNCGYKPFLHTTAERDNDVQDALLPAYQVPGHCKGGYVAGKTPSRVTAVRFVLFYDGRTNRNGHTARTSSGTEIFYPGTDYTLHAARVGAFQTVYKESFAEELERVVQNKGAALLAQPLTKNRLLAIQQHAHDAATRSLSDALVGIRARNLTLVGLSNAEVQKSNAWFAKDPTFGRRPRADYHAKPGWATPA
jgi:hypothetical protein